MLNPMIIGIAYMMQRFLARTAVPGLSTPQSESVLQRLIILKLMREATFLLSCSRTVYMLVTIGGPVGIIGSMF